MPSHRCFAISSVTRTHILRCATFFVRNTASVIKSLSTAFNSCAAMTCAGP